MMLNDLRIGNLVTPLNDIGDPIDDCNWRITTIARNYVCVEYITEITRSSVDIKGIKLTRELLLRCGFYNDNNSDDYILDDCIELRLKDDDWVEPSFDVILKGSYITYLSDIHELQNLYYFLNKIELDIRNV